MELDKIVVIKKETPLEELLKRYSTTSQVKFILESRGRSYETYKEEHERYHSSLSQVIRSLPKTMRHQIVDKEFLATFQFGNKDLVVAVGDDGILINVAKYIGDQPVIAVNPNEELYDGVLATCNTEGFARSLKDILKGDAGIEELTMAEATLEDGQVIYALNDLFIGMKDHASARYEIRQADKAERQSSSGVIVSTGTGSTGWMTSVVIGAKAIAGARKDRDENAEKEVGGCVPFDRESDYLLFAVREPFPTKITGTDIVFGRINEENPLYIASYMPEKGVIFSDGVQEDYLEFKAGSTAAIKPSQKKVYLVRFYDNQR